jgi:thiamine pyrophosphokinase
MKALILINGELYKPDVLLSRIHTETFDLILGADRGALHASALNVNLDAVIGDMDSISASERYGIKTTKFITYPPEKNETDLELAVHYAKKQGADQIVIVGAMGGRMDMIIGNILLITKENFSTSRIEVWHGDQTGWVIRPPGEAISGCPGDTVSLIPLGGNTSGITTDGFEYPLNNAELLLGSVRGISNRLKKSLAYIKLSHGLLFVVHTNNRV